MNIINLKPDDYYQQMNNEYNPSVSCKPTSRIMFYYGNKLNPVFPKSKFTQPEDIVMELLHTPEAKYWCEERGFGRDEIEDPNTTNEIYPKYLDKLLFGKTVSDFSYSMPIEKMITKLVDGEVLMTSGEFNYFLKSKNTTTKVSHSICLIGLVNEGFLIADPLNKDFHTEYRDGKGYQVIMTFDEARSIIKGTTSNKWCHFILH